MRLSLFLLLVLSIAAVPLAVRADVYTADEGGSTLTVLSGANRVRVALPLPPHNVQHVSASQLLLVTATAHGHDAAHGVASGELVAFAAKDMQQGPLWRLPVGEHPAHVVADSAGRFAYVTLTGEDRVAVVDLAEKKITGWIATGHQPHGLRLSADDRYALVANMGGGSVSLLDVQQRQLLAEIETGGRPIQTAISPDGHTGYVTLAGSNQLAVLDIDRREVIRLLALETSPAQVYLAAGQVLVAQQGTQEKPGSTVTAFSADNPEERRDIEVCAGPHGIVAAADGKTAFVTCVYASAVAVVDLESYRQTAEIPVGEQPNGISWSP